MIGINLCLLTNQFYYFDIDPIHIYIDNISIKDRYNDSTIKSVNKLIKKIDNLLRQLITMFVTSK